MVALSRKLAQEAGVADKAQFVEGDMYEADISKATVMALFLLPVNMNRLAPKFLDLAPGSRIVANTFGIDGWEPDVRVTLPQASECESWCEVLLWIVPAKVARHVDAGRTDGCTLTQEYQTVQGTLTLNGDQRNTVAKGRMNGEEICLRRRRPDLHRQGEGQPDRGNGDDGERPAWHGAAARQ